MSNLVWHNEPNTSWTYCGGFEIRKILDRFILSRDQSSRDYWREWIGSFHSLLTAQAIAEIIIDAEAYHPPINEPVKKKKKTKKPEFKRLSFKELCDLESKHSCMIG